jgi:hypothetical protein
MIMNMVKLCVGVSSVEQLEDYRTEECARRRANGEPEMIAHVTRMMPTKKVEIESGGSLYWVIAGVIQCRSEIISLERVVGSDGIKRCAIMMSPEVIRTAPAPRRPFQGWRYLKPEDAPRDLSGPSGDDDLPDDLRSKLMEIGAW